MTLIQAQQRYIDRKNKCHPGHRARVGRSAHKELFQWAESRGLDAKVICKDAREMAELEYNADE